MYLDLLIVILQESLTKKFIDDPNRTRINIFFPLISELSIFAGVWIGLPGCIKELDELANMYCQNSGKDQLKIIQQSGEIIEKLDDTDLPFGRRYLKIMKLAKGNCVEFVNAEIDRITKLMKTKLSQEKIEDLSLNLNVLKSFWQITIKDEL